VNATLQREPRMSAAAEQREKEKVLKVKLSELFPDSIPHIDRCFDPVSRR